jgi:type I restriction enzyme S subunit
MKSGFKETSVGLIPEDWDVFKIKEFTSVVTGNTPPTIDAENYGDDYLFVTPTDISAQKYIKTTQRKLSQKGFELSRSLPPNSLLVTCIASIGKNAIVSERACFNQQINAILPSDRHNTDFLYYLIEREKKKLLLLAGQTAVLIINKSVFENHIIALPNILEQNKIASILSTVDDKIDAISERITQTQQLKNGLMQRLLTKGFGHTKFKDSPLGEIPDSWRIKSIGEFAEVTAGATPSTKESKYWGGNIPWMNSGEINLRRIKSVEGRITELGFKSSSTKMIPPFSILIALAGQGKTRGKVAMNGIELCTNQSLAAIMNLQLVVPEFLFQNLDLRYIELRRMSTGDGGRGGLNLQIIKSIQVALPPYDEQKQIAQILSTFDDKLDLLQEKKIKYDELKAGLMQLLLTGKVRTRI